MARTLAIEIFVMLVIGLALGLIGPFGTFETHAGLRIAYWMVFALAGYAIFRPLVTVGRWLSEALGVSPLIGIGLALAVASLPMTLLVATMFSGFDVRAALRWDALGQLYFQVWLIGFLINGFFMLLFRDKEGFALPVVAEPVEAAIPPAATPAKPAFHDRLPPGFGTLIALKGEDHYVRAISATRDELILVRLRDAMAELESEGGMQVHRSWWVARAAVASVRREGRAATLILSNGTEVPVAREKLPVLRAAGWL
jgi:LytTr DNA-binding domain